MQVAVELKKAPIARITKIIHRTEDIPTVKKIRHSFTHPPTFPFKFASEEFRGVLGPGALEIEHNSIVETITDEIDLAV